MKRPLVALLLALSGTSALAQSSPNLTYGQVLTPGQWNQLFINKQDTLGFTPLSVAGGVMTGPLVTEQSGTAGAGLNLPPGAAPTSPNNGDIWSTSSGFYGQVNGVTVGPFSESTSGSFAKTAPISLSFPSSVVTYGLNYGASLTLSGSNLVVNLGNANTWTATQAFPNGSLTNAELANSTISGVALGANLATLTFGTHLTGTSYNGSGAITLGTDATSANTASTIVARDASGNFTAGTISAALTGHASLDLAISSLGTNVQTALGNTLNAAGGIVGFSGALGTPASGVATNLTGLPVSTGLSGAGTGVLAALGNAINGASGLVGFSGSLGTPISGTLTNATGLPISTGLSGTGTGVLTALANAVNATGGLVTFSGALGTPISGVLTNATGLPLSTGVTGTLQAAQEPAHTGDVTNTAGSLALTLATVNSNIGGCGSSTAIPAVTLNAKGLSTACTTSAVIAPAGTLSGTTLNSTVVASSLTSVGTLTGGATGAGFTVALGSSTVTGFLSAANGGSGIASPAVHSLMVAEGSSAFNLLAAGTGTIIQGASSADPTATATPVLGVNAATGGTLGLANGGAGGATITLKNLGALSAYNFNLPTGPGTAGQPLISGAGGATSTSWGSLSGNTTTFATSSGTLTSTHCVSIDANGNFVDAGGTCTTGGGGGTVSSGTLNQLALYASAGTTVQGTSTIPSTITWNGAVIGGTYGGTGVNNGSSTLTLAGNVTHSGAFARTFVATGTTSVTLPTSGTLLSTAAAVTVAQGGTGLATLTAHAAITGNGTSTPNFVAPGAANNVMASNGTDWVSAAPTSYCTILTQANVTSPVASINLTSLMSGTYAHYQLQFQNLGTTTGSASLKVWASTSNGGTWDTTASDYTTSAGNSSGGFQNGPGGGGVDNPQGLSGQIDFYSTQQTVLKANSIVIDGGIASGTPTSISPTNVVYSPTGSIINALQLIESTGNIQGRYAFLGCTY